MSDGTRYEFSLLNIISKEKVSDTVIFRMSIDPLRYYHKLEDEGISNYTLSQLNDSTYLYMDQVEIEIPKNFLESFIKKKDNEIDFRGYFKFVNRKRVRLVSLSSFALWWFNIFPVLLLLLPIMYIKSLKD